MACSLLEDELLDQPEANPFWSAAADCLQGGGHHATANGRVVLGQHDVAAALQHAQLVAYGHLSLTHPLAPRA